MFQHGQSNFKEIKGECSEPTKGSKAGKLGPQVAPSSPVLKTPGQQRRVETVDPLLGSIRRRSNKTSRHRDPHGGDAKVNGPMTPLWDVGQKCELIHVNSSHWLVLNYKFLILDKVDKPAI